MKFSDLRPLVTLSAYVLSLVTLTMSAPEEPVFPRHEHCGSFAELHEWVLTTPCRLWRPLPNEAGLYGAVVLVRCIGALREGGLPVRRPAE